MKDQIRNKFFIGFPKKLKIFTNPKMLAFLWMIVLIFTDLGLLVYLSQRISRVKSKPAMDERTENKNQDNGEN